MPTLSHLDLFANITSASLVHAERCATIGKYDPNQVVVAQGEIGNGLFIVKSGTLYLKPDRSSKPPSVFLGPGEVFGELSLISSSKTSVAVVSLTPADVYFLPANVFHQLFSDELPFRQRIVELLVRRLRVRTAAGKEHPICVFVALPTDYPSQLPCALLLSLGRYVNVHGKSRVVADRRELSSVRSDLATWRASNSEDAFVLFVPQSDALDLSDLMRAGDAALVVESGVRARAISLQLHRLHVDTAVARIGDAILRVAEADEPWSHVVTERDLESALSEATVSHCSEIDRITRWMARRSIGLALGAGAARGFAHLGVLEVLESAKIPVDFLVGSSIGGIVALLYGLGGTAHSAQAMAMSSIGSRSLIRDVSWLPRAGVFAGRKIRRNAEKLGAGVYMRDLKHPAIAVATDLISGQRITLQSGAVASALVATAAIPGIFPPVMQHDRVLVDGGLTSLVPVDLLASGRCGLKIAVNVQPEGAEYRHSTNDALARTLNRTFSMVSIIARSWDLLGSAHGVRECESADIVIRPEVSARSGSDFDSFEYFVEQGRQSALSSLALIRSEAERVLKRSP
jgi:NTE family protein